MPFSFLKIDRSFVTGLQTKASDRVVVRVILDLCRQLDLQVMAEGIETIDQLETLQSLSCHWLQGFLFAKPMADTVLFDLLSRPFPAEWFSEQSVVPPAA